MKTKILVVDDEEDLCEILQFNLESEGYEVDIAFSAEEALKKNIENYHLMLLDVMMGKLSGYKLAEKLKKEQNISVPIIFLTAKNTENDTLTGFNLGADDYIAKPFSIKEVLARIKAVLRRTLHTENISEVLKIENIEIDFDKKLVSVDNRKINLTKKEFDILLLLIRHEGKYFDRQQILHRVWDDDIIVTERTVDVNITRLRKKMGEAGKFIHSRSGYGYSFEV